MATARKRFVSVGMRLAAGTSAVVFLASGLVYAGLARFQRQQIISSKLQAGRAVFSLFAQLVETSIVFDDAKGLDEALGYLKRDDDVLLARVLSVKPGRQGRLLGEYHRPGFDLPRAAPIDPGEHVRERQVELVRDISDAAGEPVGRAVLILSLEKELDAFQRLMRQVLLAAIGIALALVLLIVGGARRRILRPLRQLTEAADRLGQGEQVPLEISEEDEVGILAGAFDRMATTIRERERALAAANEALTALSLTDPLTGLKNRRYLDSTLGTLTDEVLRLHARLPSGKAPPKVDMIFIMVDLDHFKAVNDTYGHAAGDLVIQQTRTLLVNACRKSDIVARWGGEEFLVVARSTRRDHGHYLAERIRASVRAHAFDVGGGALLHKTCSVGWAPFPFLPEAPQAVSWEEVVQLADRCLYAAKHGGRDRSVGLTAVRGLRGAGLARRIADDFDALAAAGQLDLRRFGGEERGFEPPLPREEPSPS